MTTIQVPPCGQHRGAPQTQHNAAEFSRTLCIFWSGTKGSVAHDVIKEKLAYYPSAVHAIRGVRKVAQRNNCFRFDVSVEPSAFPRMLRRARAIAGNMGWYAKAHEPWNTRKDKAVTLRRATGSSTSGHRVGSLNMNRAHGKRAELAEAAGDILKASVLAVQETWLKTTDWPLKLGGF